jgi:hypothetical protein
MIPTQGAVIVSRSYDGMLNRQAAGVQGTRRCRVANGVSIELGWACIASPTITIPGPLHRI